MSETEFSWGGPELRAKSVADLARELGELNKALEAGIDVIFAEHNLPEEVNEAAGALARAYAVLEGVWTLGQCFDLPHEKRIAQAPELGALLAAVASAEVRFVAALARSRQDWLYAWLRERAPEANGVRPPVAGA